MVSVAGRLVPASAGIGAGGVAVVGIMPASAMGIRIRGRWGLGYGPWLQPWLGRWAWGDRIEGSSSPHCTWAAKSGAQRRGDDRLLQLVAGPQCNSQSCCA